MADPRWLAPEMAASYVGKRVDELPRLVKRGLLPRPSYHFGPRQPRWDREALDALFEGKQARPSMDAAVQEIASALAQGSRKGRSSQAR